MSYTSVEAAAITVLQLHADYSTANVSAGDYRILAKGLVKYVVFQPGSILDRGTSQASRRMRTLWEINLELFLPFTDEISTIASEIRAERSIVIDHMDAYPTLNGATGVIMASMTGGSPPQDWRGESRRWWKQSFRLEVEERQTIAIAE